MPEGLKLNPSGTFFRVDESSTQSGPDVIETEGPPVTQQCCILHAALSLLTQFLGLAGRMMLQHRRPALCFERCCTVQTKEKGRGSQGKNAEEMKTNIK